MAKPKHILVIRLSAMGDVAMTVPVLRAFSLQYPEVKITVVSRPFFKPFFDGIPNVNFFAIDLKERHKGFFGLLRLYKDLKKLKIDAVADLHNVLRSKIIRNLFALSGKKINNGLELFNLAKAEDKVAIEVFEKMGEDLAAIVIPWLEKFSADGFIIGGKIANASEFFLPVFNRKLKEAGSNVSVSVSTDNEIAALLGATSLLYTA